jgi:hypothetical protein
MKYKIDANPTTWLRYLDEVLDLLEVNEAVFFLQQLDEFLMLAPQLGGCLLSLLLQFGVLIWSAQENEMHGCTLPRTRRLLQNVWSLPQETSTRSCRSHNRRFSEN